MQEQRKAWTEHFISDISTHTTLLSNKKAETNACYVCVTLVKVDLYILSLASLNRHLKKSLKFSFKET